MADKQFISLENLSRFKTKQDAFNDSKFAKLSSIPTKVSQLENDVEYQTKEQIDAAINQAVASVMTYKGTKETVGELPMEDNKVGDIWHVTEDGAEYAWDGTKWEVLGSTMDVSMAWDDITGKPSEFTPAAHTHVVEDITDLDLSKYTDETVAVYNAALTSAKAVMRDETLSKDDQQVVDDAAAQLQAAYDALALKDDTTDEDPDDNPGTTDPDDSKPGTGDADQTKPGTGDAGQTNQGTADKTGSGSAVKTGDSTPVVLWAVILIAAAGAVTGVVVVRRKKSGR